MYKTLKNAVFISKIILYKRCGLLIAAVNKEREQLVLLF